MKKLLGLIALLTVCFTLNAQAAPVSATPVRTVFNCCAAIPTAWTTLVASTTKAVKGISITNSGTVGFQLAIGAAGSEVAQITVPASQTYAVYYPIVLGQSQRISIESYGSTGSVGEADFNLFYN